MLQQQLLSLDASLPVALTCLLFALATGLTLARHLYCEQHPKYDVLGFLDDYAFLAQALLALLECRWRSSDLLFAVELQMESIG